MPTAMGTVRSHGIVVRPPCRVASRRVADLLLPAQFGGLHATLLLAKHAGHLILRKWPRRIIRCHLTSHHTNDIEFGEHVKPEVNAHT